MSNLFVDTEIDIVKLTLKKKDGSGTSVFYIGLDFYPDQQIVSGLPEVYPILAEVPVAKRTAGQQVAVREEIDIKCFGKSYLFHASSTLFDLKSTYEFVGSKAELLYFPKASEPQLSSVANENIRMTLEIIDISYDDSSSLLTISTRDTWFNDKELNSIFSVDNFPNLDPNYEGEFGSFGFGQSTDMSSGVMIDAPCIDKGQVPILYPDHQYITLFAGWTYLNHSHQNFRRLMVRNQTKEISDVEFLSVEPTSNVDIPIFTTTSGSDAFGSDSRRILSATTLYHLYSAPSDYSKLLHLIYPYMYWNNAYYAAKFDGSKWMGCAPDDAFQFKDDDGTMFAWVYLDNKAATQFIFSKHYSSTQRDWSIRYSQSSDRFVFECYDVSGSSIGSVTANNFGSPTVATWYFVQWRRDGNTIGIRVDNGSEDTATTSGTLNRSNAGVRIGCRRNSGSNTDFFTGRIQGFGGYRKWVGTTLLNSIYNSGNGKISADFTEAEREELSFYIQMSDLNSKIFTDRIGNHDFNTSFDFLPIRGKVAFTSSGDDGELYCTIYSTKYAAESDLYIPDQALRKIKHDIYAGTVAQLGDRPLFQIEPPLPTVPGAKYLFEFSWTGGARSESRSPYMDARSYTGQTVYIKRNNNDRDGGLIKLANTSLHLQVYAMGIASGFGSYNGGIGTGIRHAEYTLYAPTTLRPGGNLYPVNPIEGLEFKIGQDMIQDDASGTYTGTANKLIDNPSDIIRFILQNVSFANLSSTLIDSSFTSVRNSLAALGLDMEFAVSSSMTARDLIVQICRQARIRFYKKANGKMALNFPKSISTIDFDLNEYTMRGDLGLSGVGKEAEENVVNEFRQGYAPDILNVSKDPALIRKAKTDKYSGLVITTPTESTSNDLYRKVLCNNSQALYGKRELTDPLDCYDSATKAIKIQNYYVDRFNQRQRRCVVRIPRRNFYDTIELFSTISVSHTGLEDDQPSNLQIKFSNDGTPITLYDQGILAKGWFGGNLKGEVTSITEQGTFMIIEAQELPILEN